MLFSVLAWHGDLAIKIWARNNLLGACFLVDLCNGGVCAFLPTIPTLVVSVGTLLPQMLVQVSLDDVFYTSSIILALFGAG